MKNRILVVEDERAISDLICMNLQAAGYLTGAVYDGDAVEKYVNEEPPFDLALVDVMLPGKDGFTLMDFMKQREIPGDLSDCQVGYHLKGLWAPDGGRGLYGKTV